MQYAQLSFHSYWWVAYREVESSVSHHQTSKHQCTRLGSVFFYFLFKYWRVSSPTMSGCNLNSQASSPFSEGWKPLYQI